MAQPTEQELKIAPVEVQGQRVEGTDGASLMTDAVVNEFQGLHDHAQELGIDNGGYTEWVTGASGGNLGPQGELGRIADLTEMYTERPVSPDRGVPNVTEATAGQVGTDAGTLKWPEPAVRLGPDMKLDDVHSAADLYAERPVRNGAEPVSPGTVSPAEPTGPQVLGESADSLVDADEQAQRMEDSDAFVDQEDRQTATPEAASSQPDAVTETGDKKTPSPEDEAKATDGVRREIANSLAKYGAEIESGAENALDIRAGAISTERAAGISRSLEQQATTLDARAVDLEGQRLQAYREHQAKMEKAGFGPVTATAENLNKTPDTLAQITAREKMQKQWEAQAEKFNRQIAEAKSEAEKMRKLAAQTTELTKAKGPLPVEKPKTPGTKDGKDASLEDKGGGSSPETKAGGNGSEAHDGLEPDQVEDRESMELHFDEKNLKSMEIPDLQKEMQRTGEFIVKSEQVIAELQTELAINTARRGVLRESLDVWQKMAADTYGTGTEKVQKIAQERIADINEQLAELAAERAEISEDAEVVRAVRDGAVEYQGKINQAIEDKTKEMKEKVTAETVDIPQSILDSIGNSPTLLKRFQRQKKRNGASKSLLDFFMALGNAKKS